MSAGVRRWCLASIAATCLALAVWPGCGSGAPSGVAGAAGSHGGTGGSGVSGASAGAGTLGGAGDRGGTMGAAGDQAGNAGAGDASADVPATPTDAGAETSGAACGPMRLDRVAPDLLLLLDRS